jgi:hypothetical protein
VTREEAIAAFRNSETLAERIIEAIPDEVCSATMVMALANVFSAIATISEHDGGATVAQAEDLFRSHVAALARRRKAILEEPPS